MFFFAVAAFHLKLTNAVEGSKPGVGFRPTLQALKGKATITNCVWKLLERILDKNRVATCEVKQLDSRKQHPLSPQQKGSSLLCRLCCLNLPLILFCLGFGVLQYQVPLLCKFATFHLHSLLTSFMRSACAELHPVSMTLSIQHPADTKGQRRTVSKTDPGALGAGLPDP